MFTRVSVTVFLLMGHISVGTTLSFTCLLNLIDVKKKLNLLSRCHQGYMDKSVHSG